MRDTPTLYVMAGLPGSGKSTLARQIVADSGAVLVGRDELRINLTNMPDCGILTHIMVQMAVTLLANGKSVVIDAWNLHPHDIPKWHDVATTTRSRIDVRILKTPLEDCIRRDAQRPSPNGERSVRTAFQLGAWLLEPESISLGT